MMPFPNCRLENLRWCSASDLDSKLANETGRNVASTVRQVLFSHRRWSFSLPKPISLDFSLFLTDTHDITPVPPLPLVGEVHLGRVLFWLDGPLIRPGGCHE
jgi:hypothetical protein